MAEAQRERGGSWELLRVALQTYRNMLASIEKRYLDSPVTREALRKRFEGAVEVLRRHAYIVMPGGELVLGVPASGSAPTPTPHLVLALDGRLRRVEPGQPEYHTARVSRWRMKCTCPDAVTTAAKAQKRLEELQKQSMLLARLQARLRWRPYTTVLCKHTLAALAQATALRIVYPSDPLLQRTLTLGLLTLYLREEEKPSPEKTRRLMEHAARLIGKP